MRTAGRGSVARASLALIMLAALATGCTSPAEYIRNGFKVGPNYGRPAASVAPRWVDANLDDPNIARIHSAPADHPAWWQTFNDAVLNSLVQDAYRQNLSLRAAAMRILQARALRGIAAGDLFPQSQEAFGSYTRNAVSDNSANVRPTRFFDEWQTGFNLGWELDFWGRFRRAIEAADAELDASVENYDDVLVLLLSEVAQRYAEIRTYELRLKLADDNVRIQSRSLGLAEQKFREGKVSRLDPAQARLNLAQTRALIPPLESARRQALDQLCVLLGVPPGALEQRLANPARRDAVPAAPPAVAVGVPAELLRRRPDVRRAEREVAAQSARIGIAVSDLYPHFAISGSVFFDAAKFQDLFKSGSLAGNVGPSFRWDLLNYGRLVNNIRFQDARFQELALQYQNTVLQANAEAESALVGFLKSQQEVNALTESTSAAQESYELVSLLYKEGKADFNRVYVVQLVLTQQQDQLAATRGRVARNLIQLYKALGGGWQIRLGGPSPQPQAAPAPQPPEFGPMMPARP